MNEKINNRVSIVIPAYNAETTLERCVSSALAQNYCDLEIIVVDDGSNDATQAKARALSEQDTRVRIIHQDNLGLSGARNTGIENASGDLLFFLDADDYIEPHEISELVSVMEAASADMVVGGISNMDEAGRVISTVAIPPRITTEKGFWEGYERGTKSEDHTEYVVACGKLFRRGLFKTERFDVGKIHEDEFIIHRLVSHAKVIAFSNVAGYCYMKTDGSITRNPSPKALMDKAEGLLLRFTYFAEKEWWDFALTAISEARGALSNALELQQPMVSRERFTELNRRWKNGLVSVLRHSSGNAKQKALCILFAASPKAYVILKGNR